MKIKSLTEKADQADTIQKEHNLLKTQYARQVKLVRQKDENINDLEAENEQMQGFIN